MQRAAWTDPACATTFPPTSVQGAPAQQDKQKLSHDETVRDLSSAFLGPLSTPNESAGNTTETAARAEGNSTAAAPESSEMDFSSPMPETGKGNQPVDSSTSLSAAASGNGGVELPAQQSSGLSSLKEAEMEQPGLNGVENLEGKEQKAVPSLGELPPLSGSQKRIPDDQKLLGSWGGGGSGSGRAFGFGASAPSFGVSRRPTKVVKKQQPVVEAEKPASVSLVISLSSDESCFDCGACKALAVLQRQIRLAVCSIVPFGVIGTSART